MCKKITMAISKSLNDDQKVVILAGDCDSLAASCIIHYMIESHKMNFSKSYGHLKERRLSVSIIEK